MRQTLAGHSKHALVALTLMLEPRTSGTWFGMDSSASKIVLEQGHHVEDELRRGTICLILARPAALKRRVGIPRNASPTDFDLNDEGHF